MLEEAFERELVARALRGETGALEARSGRKRRLFFLERGELAFTWSNLKSETAERVAEREPGLSAEDLPRRQAVLRLAAVLADPGAERLWHAGKAPPRREALSLPAVLREALALRGTAFLEERLSTWQGAPVLEAEPEALDGLGLSPGLREWLLGLDGLRELSEVLAFPPGEPAEALAALYAALLLGLASCRELSSAGTVVLPGEGDESGEIEALLAEAIRPGGGLEGGGDASPGGAEPAPRGEAEPARDPAVEALERELRRVEQAEDHFAVLGVSPEATPEQLRAAYFELARLLHPDRLPAGAPEELARRAEEAFDRLREAWEELKDEDSRREYIERVVHGRKSEEDLAMEQVQEILEAEAVFRRGLAAFHAGRLGPARRFFQEAVERLPQSPEFRVYLGYLNWRSAAGDPERAEAGKAMLREALEQNKKLDQGWTLLGRIYLEEGEEAVAKRCFVQALRINAANADAQRELERLKRRREKERKGERRGFLASLFRRKG